MLKVKQMSVNAFWKGEVEVKARAEDQGQDYAVRVLGKGSLIKESSCSCKENKEKAVCPHVRAVWDAYQRSGKKIGEEKKTVMVYTSPEVRTMIREYTNREVARIQQEGQESFVSFVARLKINRKTGDIRVEFKLGRERMYLVKDLLSFAQAMRQKTYVEYGKNFAFYHCLDAFTRESRPLVEFVVELVNTYRDYYGQFRRASFETQPPLREFHLSRENRDRFFFLTENQVLEVELGTGSSPAEKGEFLVCRQNPQFHIPIRMKGQDGLEISISGKRPVFLGEKYLYLLGTNRIYCCDEGCSRDMGVFLDLMGQAVQNRIQINGRDVPLFYERVLLRIEPYCIFEGDEIQWENYRPEPLQAEFFFDSKAPGQVQMQPVLSYGDYAFHPVEDEKLPRTVCRDVPGEFRVSQLIARYFKLPDEAGKKLVIQNDEEALYALLEHGLGEFSRLGRVELSDTVRQWKILPPAKVHASVSMGEGWLDIQVDLEGMTGEELEEILRAYQQKRPFYRRKTGEFLRLEDEGLTAVARLSTSLSLSGKQLLEKGVRLPGYRALYLDSLLKEGPGISFYRNQMFKAVVRGMKVVEDSDFPVPQELFSVLRGYQKTGFRWLRTLDAYGFGGILADDMGLGKTIQMIALFVDEYKNWENERKLPSLIVCPASLVYNWENEFQKFAPFLKICTIAGSWTEREDLLKTLEKGEYPVLITSYDLLKRDMEYYEKLSFRFQVIDEAQYIKNAATQSAKAVKAVRARTRFALTGTPVENRLSELWSIFDYLMPEFLFSYSAFRRQYELPIVREGDKEALANLRRLIGPFVLRRLKKDVLKELPEKLENYVYTKLEGQQKKLYMANAASLKLQLEGATDSSYSSERFQILAQLTRLRQICCAPQLCYDSYRGTSAKLETCMDLIRNGVAGGHKILLFSQFTSMLDILEKRLKEEEIGYYLLTGSTDKEKRLQMVEAFQGDDVPVFLISLKAGGTGLNLTAADMVIHYDPWWNLAAENQATDRTHRIGQTKQVSVFKLIAKGTIEENIVRLQEAKKDLAEQIVTEENRALGSLTRGELLEILKGGTG